MTTPPHRPVYYRWLERILKLLGFRLDTPAIGIASVPIDKKCCRLCLTTDYPIPVIRIDLVIGYDDVIQYGAWISGYPSLMEREVAVCVYVNETPHVWKTNCRLVRG